MNDVSSIGGPEEEVSLAQFGRKGDGQPGIAPLPGGTKAFDRRRLLTSLEWACGKRDNSALLPGNRACAKRWQ
jgi:hypothetical protein